MNIFQAIFLGALQGLTEFLPISSSGHLVIFQKVFGFSEPPIAFDALVHLGTLIALFIFFRKDFKKIIQSLKKGTREKEEYKNLFLNLAVGTLPIVIWGNLFIEKINIVFDSFLFTGISFLFTAIILFMTAFTREFKKGFNEIKISDSIIVGIFQAFSILPGLSRSGLTISSGLFQGFRRDVAFKFSFFLGIIAILGANILQIPEFSTFTGREVLTGFLGFLSSVFVGFFTLKWLKKIFLKGKFHYFGVYCAILGIICILLSLK